MKSAANGSVLKYWDKVTNTWKQLGGGGSSDSVNYDSNGNIPLREKTKVLGTNEQGVQSELIGLGEYDIAGEIFDQVELGSEHIHTNINSKDRPTVETPEGKKEIAYLSDIGITKFDNAYDFLNLIWESPTNLPTSEELISSFGGIDNYMRIWTGILNGHILSLVYRNINGYVTTYSTLSTSNDFLESVDIYRLTINIIDGVWMYEVVIDYSNTQKEMSLFVYNQYEFQFVG